MRKYLLPLFGAVLTIMVTINPAAATSLSFEQSRETYDVGETITFDLFADIDQEHAVFGFGFDLSFDGGSSYVSGPGERGSFLTFTEFRVNSSVFDDPLPPLWDDGDTISGAVDFESSDVWGTDILLGTFFFDAPSSGIIGAENIYLGAPNPHDPLTPDGLLMGNSMTPISLMPDNPTATAAPVPEPSTMLLFGVGVLGMAGFRKIFSGEPDKGEE